MGFSFPAFHYEWIRLRPLIPQSAIFSVSLTLLTGLNHSLLPSPLLQPHWLGCWAHSPTKLLPRACPWPGPPVPCLPQAHSPSHSGLLRKQAFLTPFPTAFSVTCCPITQGFLPSTFSTDTVILMWVL